MIQESKLVVTSITGKTLRLISVNRKLISQTKLRNRVLASKKDSSFLFFLYQIRIEKKRNKKSPHPPQQSQVHPHIPIMYPIN